MLESSQWLEAAPFEFARAMLNSATACACPSNDPVRPLPTPIGLFPNVPLPISVFDQGSPTTHTHPIQYIQPHKNSKMAVLVDEELRRVAGMAHVVCAVLSFVASIAMYAHMRMLRTETRLFRYFVFARFFICSAFFAIGGLLVSLLVVFGTKPGIWCSTQGGFFVGAKFAGLFTCFVTFLLIQRILGDLSKIHMPYVRAGTVYNLAFAIAGVMTLGLSVSGLVADTAVWCDFSHAEDAKMIRWVLMNTLILAAFVGSLYMLFQIKVSAKLYEDYANDASSASRSNAEDEDDPFEFEDDAGNNTDDDEIPEMGRTEDGPKLSPAEVHAELYLMLVPCAVWIFCMFFGIIYEYALDNAGPQKRSRSLPDTALFQNDNMLLMLYSTLTPLAGFLLFFVAAVIGMVLSKDKKPEYVKMKAASNLSEDDILEIKSKQPAVHKD